MMKALLVLPPHAGDPGGVPKMMIEAGSNQYMGEVFERMNWGARQWALFSLRQVFSSKLPTRDPIHGCTSAAPAVLLVVRVPTRLTPNPST
eukprot:1381642-Amphidinium_carterae.2